MKNYTLVLSLLLLIISCNTDNHNIDKKITKPKNIILMIGDGMGTTHLYSAYIKNKGHLNAERMKHIGFSKTYSANSLITDSGAGGTALSSGYKTNNNMIGMTPDSIENSSILHYAEQFGKSTGIVSTCALTHATPASFVAHEPSRYNYEEIAYDFLSTDIDVMIGGGLDHFNKRKDGLKLTDTLINKGYSVYFNLDELLSSSASKIAGLLYENHPPPIKDGRGDFLTKSSLKALDILSKNEDGFFLMIEGSQIDWGGHDKDSYYVVSETVDFDNTIGAILDFADKNKETLVIVTADHETGGYAIIDGNIKEGIVEGNFTTDHHTAVMVPILAYGPGAEEFIGIMENVDIFTKMYDAFGFDQKVRNN